MSFQPKPLSERGVPAALEKAMRYRLLNEPFEAESICHDILAVDPDNQQALTTLILAMSDQLCREGGARVSDVEALLPRLEGEYEREYYAGIMCERRAEAYLRRGRRGGGPMAYDWLTRAMEHYERAEGLSPEGNDDAILRWNTCGRLIERRADVKASRPQRGPMMLE